MPAFLAFIPGKIWLGLGLVGLVVGIFMLGKCSDNDERSALEAQVDQTNRSGEAVANAAEMAIDKIGDRTVTEQSLDRAVDATVKEIDRAQSADAIRDAVLDGVCGSPSHRNDPACQMRQPDPR